MVSLIFYLPPFFKKTFSLPILASSKKVILLINYLKERQPYENKNVLFNSMKKMSPYLQVKGEQLEAMFFRK